MNHPPLNNPPDFQKSASLEQCQLTFLHRLFWLGVACLIAGFTLMILIGLHVIVLPYGSALFFAGPAVAVFRLFKTALIWLFPKPSERPPIKPPPPKTQA